MGVAIYSAGQGLKCFLTCVDLEDWIYWIDFLPFCTREMGTFLFALLLHTKSLTKNECSHFFLLSDLGLTLVLLNK